MSPADTTADALDAFARELSEVEWLGRRSVTLEPVRLATIDIVLVVLGATMGAALYLLVRF